MLQGNQVIPTQDYDAVMELIILNKSVH